MDSFQGNLLNAITKLVSESRRMMGLYEMFENFTPQELKKDPVADLTVKKMRAADCFQNLRDWQVKLEAAQAEVSAAFADGTHEDKMDRFENIMHDLANEREKYMVTTFMNEALRELAELN